MAYRRRNAKRDRQWVPVDREWIDLKTANSVVGTEVLSDVEGLIDWNARLVRILGTLSIVGSSVSTSQAPVLGMGLVVVDTLVAPSVGSLTDTYADKEWLWRKWYALPSNMALDNASIFNAVGGPYGRLDVDIQLRGGKGLVIERDKKLLWTWEVSGLTAGTFDIRFQGVMLAEAPSA